MLANIVDEVRGAVHDRGVHDLPPAADLRLEQRGEHADDEVHRPAAEVAEQVRRELRAVRVLAEAVQRAGERDVVRCRARRCAASGPSWPQPVIRP